MRAAFRYLSIFSAVSFFSLLFKVLAVNIAVLPVLTGLERLNYRMPGLFKVLCCMLVFSDWSQQPTCPQARQILR